MALRFGFVGFRHGHIYSLVKKVQDTDGMTIAAVIRSSQKVIQIQRAADEGLREVDF